MYNCGLSVECTVSLDKRLERWFVRMYIPLQYEKCHTLSRVGGWEPLDHSAVGELLLGVF